MDDEPRIREEYADLRDGTTYVTQVMEVDTEFVDVASFHLKFGLLHSSVPRRLTPGKMGERFQFLDEELGELRLAYAQGDMEKVFDALIDLVYVAKGTAVMMGLPWREGWKEVQRANMDKVRGTTHRGHAVDVTKPPGWLPPNLQAVLARAGYNPELPEIDDVEPS